MGVWGKVRVLWRKDGSVGGGKVCFFILKALSSEMDPAEIRLIR
jgi:hypothetical protein